jgi:hypothetical protein
MDAHVEYQFSGKILERRHDARIVSSRLGMIRVLLEQLGRTMCEGLTIGLMSGSGNVLQRLDTPTLGL